MSVQIKTEMENNNTTMHAKATTVGIFLNDYLEKKILDKQGYLRTLK